MGTLPLTPPERWGYGVPEGGAGYGRSLGPVNARSASGAYSRRTRIISATTLTAISSCVRAPMGSPMGV